MRRRLTLTVKTALVFMLFAILLLGAMGVLAYRSGREALREAISTELLARANEKEATLSHWLKGGQTQLGSLAAALQSDAAPALLTAAGSGAAAFRAGHGRVIATLRPWVGAGGFLELFVLAPDSGQVLVSTDAGEEGKFKEDRPYFVCQAVPGGRERGGVDE